MAEQPAAQLMPAIDRMLRESALDRACAAFHPGGEWSGELHRHPCRAEHGKGIGACNRSADRFHLASRRARKPRQCAAEFPRAGRLQLALLDAGRNEFYALRVGTEWLVSYEEIASAAEAGSPLIVAEETLAERLAAWRPALAGPLDACAAARAALGRLRSGETDDLATLDANYLRRSDAELFARPAPAPTR